MELEALSWIAATENRFAVFDGLARRPPEDPPSLARSLADRTRPRADGLLLVLPPRRAGDVRMEVFNADGSAAEACGNGLRCVAKLAVERRHAPPSLVVETVAGPRRVEVELAGGRVVGARAELGTPALERGVELETGSTRCRVDLVDLGNPHCVLFVEALDATDVARLGPQLERHRRFPRRTNVEFVEVGPGGLRLRVWERGVGETRSCGTGTAAAAVAAIARGLAQSPVEVATPGGRLRVEWKEGSAWLAGEVRSWSPELVGDLTPFIR